HHGERRRDCHSAPRVRRPRVHRLDPRRDWSPLRGAEYLCGNRFSPWPHAAGGIRALWTPIPLVWYGIRRQSRYGRWSGSAPRCIRCWRPCTWTSILPRRLLDRLSEDLTFSDIIFALVT